METTQQTEQQRSADRRRRELLEAADRVVLRDGPRRSMNAIAAEAGITKPILYRHFGDKGGLYRALAKRHTDALLDSLRAALDAPAERRERVEATLDTYLAAIEARPQVYRFLMHPAEDAPRRPSAGFDVGQHSAPLLRRLGEELAKVIEERLDLGPGSAAAGPGLGPRHRRHDARGRRLVAGRTALLRAAELVRQPGRPAVGAAGRRRATASAARGSERRAVACGPVRLVAPAAEPRMSQPRAPGATARARKLAAACRISAGGASPSGGPCTTCPPGGRTRAAGSARRSRCPRSAPARRSTVTPSTTAWS